MDSRRSARPSSVELRRVTHLVAIMRSAVPKSEWKATRWNLVTQNAEAVHHSTSCRSGTNAEGGGEDAGAARAVVGLLSFFEAHPAAFTVLVSADRIVTRAERNSPSQISCSSGQSRCRAFSGTLSHTAH